MLSAFVINPKYTNRIRNFQGLFSPIASPVRKISASLSEKFAKVDDSDRRAMADVKAENEELRVTLMGVQGQLEELKRINVEREAVGEIRKFCTPMGVIGGDPGSSESLSLAGSTGDIIMQGMAVLYSQGLAGRIDRVSGAGSQVQLVTDRSFRATVKFKYWSKDATGRTTSVYRLTEPVMLQGDGAGQMLMETVFPQDAEKVQIGDDVVLEDNAWPLAVQGRKLGQVAGKSQRRDAPQFFQIHVKPMRNLKELQEVQVLTKVAAVVR